MASMNAAGPTKSTSPEPFPPHDGGFVCFLGWPGVMDVWNEPRLMVELVPGRNLSGQHV